MKRPLISGAFALAAMLCASSEAFAANPACSSLSGAPVYVAGSSAAKPMLKELSATLTSLANPVRIIYQSVSSCTGIAEVANGTGDKTTGLYWDAGTELSCDVDQTNGQVPDIGISDVYASTCDNVTVPATQKDFLGPVQVMTFIVPPSSKENVISAEAASVIYGFGGATNVVTPWSTKASILQRPNTSGTRLMIGKAIGLPSGKWAGTEVKGSGDVLDGVHNADGTNADGTIGILAADVADANRAGTAKAVKILSYQGKGATCSYFPDSSSTTFDKTNARTGDYPIWGPLHLVSKVDGSGVASNAAAKTVINYFTGTDIDAAAKKKMIDSEVAAHTIPWCAMKVKRDGEVGTAATSAYAPEGACGCYFEFKANGAAPSTCKTCTDDASCGGSLKCNYGYCEAK